MRILVSRTDGLGDAVCTLPLLFILRKLYKDVHVELYFLGSDRSKDILECVGDGTKFINWDTYKALYKQDKKQVIDFFKLHHFDIWIHVFPRIELARLAFELKVPIRIGTSHRLYHLFYCNRWVHFTRKNSQIHEAQLNLKLLKPLYKGMQRKSETNNTHTLTYISKVLAPPFLSIPEIENKSKNLVQALETLKNLKTQYPASKHIILHPGGVTSRLWDIKNYIFLIEKLKEKKFYFYISGTEKEYLLLHNSFDFNQSYLINLIGKLSLKEYIYFINQKEIDAFLSASTGTLHIASIFGKLSIGIFPSCKMIAPHRWKPLGPKTKIFINTTLCPKKTKYCEGGNFCQSMNQIDTHKVLDYIIKEV